MGYQELWHRLAKVYDEGEAKAIARMVYEVRYGMTLSDLLMGCDSEVPQEELEMLATRLERQEPVQYVLGEADFCGRRFDVDPSVLIPRPETEELCQWIIRSEKRKVTNNQYSILDIGTGSGCIAVTLAAEIPEAKVTAWDISTEALHVAEKNAKRTNVHVSFMKTDILNVPLTSHPSLLTSKYDLIVSNPPYICSCERKAMEQNVLDYEPETALFVPDDDPLLFYRTIARYGENTLKQGGWLYFEINPLYVSELCQMFCIMSYHDIEVKEDQFGKPRMMRAKR